MSDKPTINPMATAPATAKNEGDIAIEQALLKSLDNVLSALRLEPVGDDRFRVVGGAGGLTHVFGGQTIAQALMAAGATVEGKTLHSMHAYFLRTAKPGQPVDLVVERVRDGGSMSTRQVRLLQNQQQLFSLLASYHNNNGSLEVADPPPLVPQPEQLPLLQYWVAKMPAELREKAGRIWLEHPLPLEVRIGELPRFMGGDNVSGTRSHWMRLPREVGSDPLLHAALLAYASDFLLMDMTFHIHPDFASPPGFDGFSLDHSLWLHRPVRFDQWHLYTQEALAISGDRGLVRGTIHDTEGRLVASVMQEVLVRQRGDGARTA